MEITAAVAATPKSPLTLTNLTQDDPRTGEVQVRMSASAVCHTDAIIRIVEAVGPGVTSVAPRDRIVLSAAHTNVSERSVVTVADDASLELLGPPPCSPPCSPPWSPTPRRSSPSTWWRAAWRPSPCISPAGSPSTH